jgi:GNAT superfamily N-acetyltransferase
MLRYTVAMKTTSLAVRLAHPDDLLSLDTHFPQGPADKHQSRIERQRAGEVTYLLAWDDDKPVGHALIVWAGASHREVQAVIRDCPEVDDLFVAEGHRSQGIGTALLTAAEQFTTARGFDRLGLAVGRDNLRALALYQRLGYELTVLDDIWLAGMWINRAGQEEFWSERCRYLVKNLRNSVV